MATVATTTPEQVAVRRRPPKRRGPRRPWIFVLGWAAAVVWFFPVFWMFLTGFKTERRRRPTRPHSSSVPTLDQYEAIFGRDFVPYLINSFTASIFSTLLAIVLATAGGVRAVIGQGAEVAGLAVLLPVDADDACRRVDPSAVHPGPEHRDARQHHMLAIIYTAMNLPIAVWMIRSFLLELPQGGARGRPGRRRHALRWRCAG